MSLEQFVIFLIGVISAGTGWFARRLYEAVEALKKDLNTLEVKIGTDYVRYDRLADRLREALEPIKEGIDEIKDSLKGKADKP